MKEWITQLKEKWEAWFDPGYIDPKLRSEFIRVDNLTVDEARSEFWDRLLKSDLEYEDAIDNFETYPESDSLPASSREVLDRFLWIEWGFMDPLVDRSQVKPLEHDARFIRIGETCDGDIVLRSKGSGGCLHILRE